jgi:hypothetical protein
MYLGARSSYRRSEVEVVVRRRVWVRERVTRTALGCCAVICSKGGVRTTISQFNIPVLTDGDSIGSVNCSPHSVKIGRRSGMSGDRV